MFVIAAVTAKVTPDQFADKLASQVSKPSEAGVEWTMIVMGWYVLYGY